MFTKNRKLTKNITAFAIIPHNAWLALLHLVRVIIFWCYRAFSLTWPASMQTYCNKRKRLHKKRVRLPEDFPGTPTWPPFHCFGTPIRPP